MNRRIVLLTSGAPPGVSPKTAVNMLRYRPEQVLAVLDEARSGQSAEQAFGVGGTIPVVAALEEVPEANTLLIGIAPAGGKLPPAMREVILRAVARRMNIVSGLHEFLCEDPQIAAAAQASGSELIDVRRNTERSVAQRQGIDPGCLRIHTVGHDCNVGKMVVSLELARHLERLGHDAKFVATGQTGIMIEGDGCPIDAVVGDFINGAAEKLVLENQHHRILLIEGQASLSHPRYSSVTLGLLHGCVPDGLILCYEAGRTAVHGMDSFLIPDLATLKGVYEMMANLTHPCRVIGIGMNSRKLAAEAAAREREKVRNELGLPVCDVVRDGPEELAQAVLQLKLQLGK